MSEREQGLAWIRNTGYEGLALRAMSFLLQPDLVRANPVRLWRITHEGLQRFWASEFTAVRAQQFYFAAALGATDQGFPFAATAMAREGLRRRVFNACHMFCSDMAVDVVDTPHGVDPGACA